MEDNLTYETAYNELDQIYQAINNEQVSIDDLSTKVKRASLLINFCKQKLRDTEKEIKGILDEMDK